MLYLLFAFLVARWNRGVLPVAAALAIILAIFAGIAAPAWFDRAKDGLDSPALPEELLGLLTLLLVPVQVILIAVAMVAFNQNWHVEEERPIGDEILRREGGERHDRRPPERGGTRAVGDEQPVSALEQLSGGSSRCGPSSRTLLTASETSVSSARRSAAAAHQLVPAVVLAVEPVRLRPRGRGSPASGRGSAQPARSARR